MDAIHAEGAWMRWLALCFPLVSEAMGRICGAETPPIGFDLRPAAFGGVRCYGEFHFESDFETDLGEWSGVWRLSLGLVNRAALRQEHNAFDPAVYELHLGRLFVSGDRTEQAIRILEGNTVRGALFLPKDPLTGRKVLRRDGADWTVVTQSGDATAEALSSGAKEFRFVDFNTYVLAEQAARSARDTEVKNAAAIAHAAEALSKLAAAMPPP